MQISQERDPTRYSIRGYTRTEITVILPLHDAGDKPGAIEQLSASFLMTPARLLRNWGPPRLEDLADQPQYWSDLLDIRPEVLLLGTGERLRFPDADLMYRLQDEGIGVEFMDNAAACRTYNILMAEGRNVALVVFFD